MSRRDCRGPHIEDLWLVSGGSQYLGCLIARKAAISTFMFIATTRTINIRVRGDVKPRYEVFGPRCLDRRGRQDRNQVHAPKDHSDDEPINDMTSEMSDGDAHTDFTKFR